MAMDLVDDEIKGDDLRTLGGTLSCQKDAFLCAARGVSLGIHFQQKLGAGLLGSVLGGDSED